MYNLAKMVESGHSHRQAYIAVAQNIRDKDGNIDESLISRGMSNVSTTMQAYKVVKYVYLCIPAVVFFVCDVQPIFL